MDYESFLEKKRIRPNESGFKPIWMPDFLFDFQRFLCEWAIRGGCVALLEDCGCVAGETVMQCPNGDSRIDDLATRGEPFYVWSLSADGRVVSALADPPFLKGVAPLFRLSMQSGRSIVATLDHLFLSPSMGWIPFSDISVGDELVVDHSLSFSGSPQASSLDICQSILLSSALSFGKTVSSSQDDCSAYSHRYDEQLLLAKENALVVSPLQVDALEHNRYTFCKDGLGSGSGRSHLYQSTFHLSKTDSSIPWENSNGVGGGYQVASSESRRHFCDDQSALRFQEHASQNLLIHESVQSSDHRKLHGVPLDFSSCGVDTVIAVDYIRTDKFYDTHVPIYSNYLANGIWNHNTGKTPQSLVWAENIVRKTNKRVLVLTPLAVAEQWVDEGEKFGVEVKRSKDGKPKGKITVTNYERMQNYNPSDYEAVVCDESSRIKHFDTKTRRWVTDFLTQVRYRLLCTATPAPNDFMELGTSSEALGIMKRNQMLGMFFVNSGETTQQWVLKGHAKLLFWQWMATWSRALRKPSDLGFDDGDFILPGLETVVHAVPASNQQHLGFFVQQATTLTQHRNERRNTIESRCEKVAEIIPQDRPFICWCHLNAESDRLEQIIPEAVQVKGSDPLELKEERLHAFKTGQIRILVTKPKIACFGLNWEHCSDVSYFPSDSHEQYYQAIRRCYRFGQKRKVVCNIVMSEAEQRVYDNMARKERQSIEMYDGIIREMREFTLGRKTVKETTKKVKVPQWLLSTK